MDDYTLQQHLEALAGNAHNPDLIDETNSEPAEPISKTLNRWQTLFNLSQGQAVDRIMDHRNNLTRTRISDAHWQIIRAEMEAKGYDKEAYEYELELQKKKAALPDSVPAEEGSNVTYLIELTGPLDSPGRVAQAAGLTEDPEVVSGKSVEEARPVSLCCVDGAAKNAILRWAANEGAGFEPTILVDPRSLR